MPTRLTFAEFDAKLKSGTLSPVEYRRYLEIDPSVHVVHIRFKSGGLADAPPPGYDVDREVYYAERAKHAREFARLPLAELKRVLAEGDSWFNLPPFIRPKAIADRLQSNKLVVVRNIAHWGDTLVQILSRKEYLDEIPNFNPDWFIVSAGGNDLQDALAGGTLLQVYDANRPIEDCLSNTGTGLLMQTAEGYRTLLNQIAIKAPHLRSICYAYDYPRPKYKDGKYLGQYLKRMSYPRNTWDAVVKVMIDRLSDAIQSVVASFPNSLFLDCRGITAAYAFFDDMHPNEEGFKALAHKFEETLGVTGMNTKALALQSRLPTKARAARQTNKAKVKTVKKNKSSAGKRRKT